MKMLQQNQLQIVKHDCLSHGLAGMAQMGTAAFREYPVPFGEIQCERAVHFSFKTGTQTNGSIATCKKKKKVRMSNLFASSLRACECRRNAENITVINLHACPSPYRASVTTPYSGMRYHSRTFYFYFYTTALEHVRFS